MTASPAASIKADESTPLRVGRNMPSSVRKLPSYQAFDAQSSTTFSSTKMTDDITEDEETALISPDLVGVSHQDADLLKGGIKGVISVLLLGEFMANADTTIVFASAGKISSEFASLEDANWLSTSYSLGVCLAQPVYGKLSDIYGRKPVLLMAYFLFSVGCVIGAFAREIWQVILGRAISGIGGAGLITVGSVIVTDLVPKREIASWRAYINIAMTLGRSLGGPAGGWLTDSIGWRWLFLIQAPFFWISMLLTGLKLKLTIPPASKPTEHNDDDDINANSNNNPTRSKFKRIDFLGMTCLALSTSAIILLLDAGGNKFPWTAPISISLLTTAIIFFIAFILVEAYIAPEPLFALRILRQPNVLPSYLVMTLQGIAQISMMYCIPLYFQVTSSASTSVAGAHLVPAVVGNALAGLATGATIKRTGRFKALAVSAGLVASVTYILIFFSWNGHTSFWESLYIIPGGMGMGMAQASVFVSMTSMLDAKYMAMATGGLFLFTNLGISSGITVSNAALDAGFRRALEREFTGDGADQFIHKVTSNVHYISGLTGHVKEVVVSCYADGLKRTHIISLACSVAASAFALTIRNQQL